MVRASSSALVVISSSALLCIAEESVMPLRMMPPMKIKVSSSVNWVASLSFLNIFDSRTSRSLRAIALGLRSTVELESVEDI